MFSANGDVNEPLVALHRQLEQQGYSQPPTVQEAQVFVPQAPDYGTLCSPDHSLAVTVSGRNLAGGIGVLRIHVDNTPAFGGVCSGQNVVEPQNTFGHLLPTLTPPVPISVFSMEGGGGGSSYEATIRFVAKTTIAELAAHYSAQLEAGGWQMVASSESDLMAWSGWSFQDGDQRFVASFYMVRNAANGDRFQMTLRLDQAP
jgi:hypothetical protein